MDDPVNEKGVRRVLDSLEEPGPVLEQLGIHVLKGLPVRTDYDGK